MLKEHTLSCKSAVKPNVTGKMPGGSREYHKAKWWLPQCHKRKSHSCFVHATHLFQGNHLLVKLNCVAGHKNAMSSFLLMPFICVCICCAVFDRTIFIHLFPHT